ncbi:MAG: hypothetical protein K2X01_01900 [Cyanobacteria bacterium]|nr:hypothetical protein [Cyanobacteriota bacterium]
MNPVIRPSIGIPPSQVASASAPKSAPISSLLGDLAKFSTAKPAAASTPSFGSGLNTLG